MIPEAVSSASAGDVFNWFANLIAVVIAFIIRALYVKVNNTYTKDETMQMIDLKIVPLTQAITNQTDETRRQTTVMEKLTDSLQLLHSDMAVMQRDITHINGKINEQSPNAN